LEATEGRYTATALSEVSPDCLSHDAVSRWLRDKKLRPSEVWNSVKAYVQADKGGILMVDDTLLDKTHSKEIELVSYQYSGADHGVVPGISLVNVVWHNSKTGEALPIDFRIYAPKEDKKTKNDHFREMLKAAKHRGLQPLAVIADAWYASLNNLKAIRDCGWNWVMPLRKNRKVERNQNLENLNIPECGLRVHLRGYGWIHVFRLVDKNGHTQYVGTNLDNPDTDTVLRHIKARWTIEAYHRELKQTCGLERCQARSSRAQRNHIASSILAWIAQWRRCRANFVSAYQAKWNIIQYAIKLFMSYLWDYYKT
jgi:hypothetical protein